MTDEEIKEKRKIAVFVSQPMGGVSQEDRQAAREDARKDLDMIFGAGKYRVMDTDWSGSPEPPLKLLGLSLIAMADADAAYFARGWQDARGCRLEHDAATAYGITCISQGNFRTARERRLQIWALGDAPDGAGADADDAGGRNDGKLC